MLTAICREGVGASDWYYYYYSATGTTDGFMVLHANADGDRIFEISLETGKGGNTPQYGGWLFQYGIASVIIGVAVAVITVITVVAAAGKK